MMNDGAKKLTHLVDSFHGSGLHAVADSGLGVWLVA